MKNVGVLVDLLKQGKLGAMRHHNPYLTEALNLDGIVLTTDELLTKYPQIFPDRAKPHIIEVGCYMGKTVVELAQVNSHLNVLGLDITYKRTVKAARKIKNSKLDNARIGICDAAKFFESTEDASVAGVCVFFPDPWPKKRHEKNRLLDEEFLSLLKRKLKPDGFFWFKTDSEFYLDLVMNIVNAQGWRLSPAEKQPATLLESSYTTVFEKLFIEKGLPTFSNVLYPQ